MVPHRIQVGSLRAAGRLDDPNAIRVVVPNRVHQRLGAVGRAGRRHQEERERGERRDVLPERRRERVDLVHRRDNHGDLRVLEGYGDGLRIVAAPTPSVDECSVVQRHTEDEEAHERTEDRREQPRYRDEDAEQEPVHDDEQGQHVLGHGHDGAIKPPKHGRSPPGDTEHREPGDRRHTGHCRKETPLGRSERQRPCRCAQGHRDRAEDADDDRTEEQGLPAPAIRLGSGRNRLRGERSRPERVEQQRREPTRVQYQPCARHGRPPRNGEQGCREYRPMTQPQRHGASTEVAPGCTDVGSEQECLERGGEHDQPDRERDRGRPRRDVGGDRDADNEGQPTGDNDDEMECLRRPTRRSRPDLR